MKTPHPLHIGEPLLTRAAVLARAVGTDTRTLIRDAEAGRLPVALQVHHIGQQRVAMVCTAQARALIAALHPAMTTT